MLGWDWMCGVQIVVAISNFENNFKFKFHPKLYWKFTESIFTTFIFTSTCLFLTRHAVQEFEQL